MPSRGATLEQAPHNWRKWMGTELHFKTRDQLDWDDVISGNYFLYYTMFGQHNSLKRMEEVRRNRQWMPFPCDCPKVVTKTGERVNANLGSTARVAFMVLGKSVTIGTMASSRCSVAKMPRAKRASQPFSRKTVCGK